MPGLAHFCEHLLFMVRAFIPLSASVSPPCLRVPSNSPKRTNIRRYKLRYYAIDTFLFIDVVSIFPNIMAVLMPLLLRVTQIIISVFRLVHFMARWRDSLHFSIVHSSHSLALFARLMLWIQSTRKITSPMLGGSSS